MHNLSSHLAFSNFSSVEHTNSYYSLIYYTCEAFQTCSVDYVYYTLRTLSLVMQARSFSLKDTSKEKVSLRSLKKFAEFKFFEFGKPFDVHIKVKLFPSRSNVRVINNITNTHLMYLITFKNHCG